MSTPWTEDAECMVCHRRVKVNADDTLRLHLALDKNGRRNRDDNYCSGSWKGVSWAIEDTVPVSPMSMTYWGLRNRKETESRVSGTDVDKEHGP